MTQTKQRPDKYPISDKAIANIQLLCEELGTLLAERGMSIKEAMMQVQRDPISSLFFLVPKERHPTEEMIAVRIKEIQHKRVDRYPELYSWDAEPAQITPQKSFSEKWGGGCVVFVRPW